jgi:FAD dependent oxidoreductase TIGR03364
VRKGLRAALWSPLELTVDPPQVIGGLAEWLAAQYGVEFHWSTPVLAYSPQEITTASGRLRAGRLVVCTGTDYQALYPEAFHAEPLVRCKLQMMRTAAFGKELRLGPMLAAGLTLLHYGAFSGCASLAELTRRMDREWPEQRRFGIHVMAAQNGAGEIIVGDSHEYGDAITVFDNPEIDRLILEYLQSFARIPGFSVATRWHGHYLKHPSAPYVAANPVPEVLAVTGVGGAGMTLSFGLAERLVADWLGETA